MQRALLLRSDDRRKLTDDGIFYDKRKFVAGDLGDGNCYIYKNTFTGELGLEPLEKAKAIIARYER